MIRLGSGYIDTIAFLQELCLLCVIVACDHSCFFMLL